MRLAGCARRNILAIVAGRAAGQTNIAPSPVATAVFGAQDVNLHRIVLERAGDTIHGKTSDWHTIRCGTRGRAILVVLLDHDAVIGNTRKSDVRKGHIANRTGSIIYRLDTDSVGRVAHGRVGDSHVLHGVVIAIADGADREAVAARAGGPTPVDVLFYCSIWLVHWI